MSLVVYRSSAGSGKTFTLVKEYLKLTLKDEQVPPHKYKHILAVTFTNKAAAEMKERIIKALKELSENKQGVLVEILKAETGLDEVTISKRAEAALGSILHSYSDFAIGTIDSFIHKIVRSFSFDLNIPMDFEIEMDGEKILSIAIDELMNKIGTDEKLTKALIDFAESKADEEKDWHIEKDLQEFAAALLDEKGLVYLQKLKSLTLDDFFKIKDTLNKEITSFEASIKKIAAQAQELILSKGIPNSSFFQGDNGIGSYFKNLAEGQFDKLIPNSYVKKTIDEDKWTKAKADKEIVGAVNSIKEALSIFFHTIRSIREKSYEEYVLFTLIRKNIYSLAVLNEIEKVVAGIKKENNILHISEFNKIISAIVFDQPAPFIYERIGEKYENYLVDEFQDTSVLQWQNLLPLIDNALAYDHFNMIVGDGKQSIYRWRGGEVEQFTRLPEIKNENDNELLKEREQTLKNHFVEKKLRENYRSRPGIINFNNIFFLEVSSQLSQENKLIYNDFQQFSKETSDEGYVSIELIKEEGRDEADELAGQKTLHIIDQCVKEGYTHSEITILTRNNKEGNKITSYLVEKGVSVVSSESLLLQNSPVVNFMIAVLSCLRDIRNVVAKAAVVEYLLKNKKIKAGVVSDTIEEALFSNENFSKFLLKHGFPLNAFALLKMPLYDLCEELTRIFILNEKNDPYLLFFMEEVFSYSANRSNSVIDFIEWWELQKEKSSIVISEGASSVNVMTIHKSKGLEFSVVIMPYGNWASTRNDEQIWVNVENEKIPELTSSLVDLSKKTKEAGYGNEFDTEKDKQKLDNINLLYVAMTRPVDRLYIITTPVNRNRDISRFFIDFLKKNEKWNEDRSVYEYGSKPVRKSKDKINKDVNRIVKTNSSNWRNKVAIRTSGGQHDTKQKKDRGIVIHEIFSRIRTSEDVESAVNRSFYAGEINDHEKEIFTGRIKKLISDPLLNSYFQKNIRIKLESDIILSGGETYRPDRVVFQQDKAAIIDYKTGKAYEEHKKQLYQYESLLKKMGYKQVEKLLVYFEEGRIEKL